MSNNPQVTRLLKEIEENNHKKVIVYALDGCPACNDVKTKFDKIGLTYETVIMNGNDEMWEEEAVLIHDETAKLLIKNYGKGHEILSVHKVSILWDGVDWELFFLSFINDEKQSSFLVIEEIFSDASETELLTFNTFNLIKSHHHKSHDSSNIERY